ncbi:MAG TPA: P1 family peptidase [Acidimicrobiia bacterium]|nr:P1 family peptidase [Acidimicrobiia bacterium]
MTRPRLRHLGITIGTLPPGPHNAITDVPGVWVGHTTVIRDEPRVARTGVTMVVPRENRVWDDYCFAGHFSFNGNGELTGLPWLDESGMLGSPVAITNTHQVGLVRDALVRYSVEQGVIDGFILPVVGETWDGWLNDIDAFSLTEEDALTALRNAAPGPVAEGNVGGGTGMICHDFKGGIGTASRLCRAGGGAWTVGALVQANYGDRADLRLDGLPLGRLIGCDRVPCAYPEEQDPGGSIIVVVATDAPLIPTQCARLARRATVGLARVGGVGHNGSGDLFLAFATGNHLPAGDQRRRLEMLDHKAMNPLFSATAEAVEEAILNALCAAETMTGYLGRTAHALPLDAVTAAWAQRAW